jgi:hypothetical protein
LKYLETVRAKEGEKKIKEIENKVIKRLNISKNEINVLAENYINLDQNHQF